MASFTLSQNACKAFQMPSKALKGRQSRSIVVRCDATPQEAQTSRRASLLMGVASTMALVAGPAVIETPKADAKLVERTIPAKNLSTSQKKDLIADLQRRATKEIMNVLTVDDAPAAMRLLLHDAASYDAVSKTGGVNGSIVLSEELNRPENKDLKDIVAKLSKARDAVNASKNPEQEPLGWADTIVLAVKATQEAAWVKILRDRNPTNADYLANNFANKIDVRIGRVDATTPDREVKIPTQDASPEEVRNFFNQLGVKDPKDYGGPLAKKPPFYERVSFLFWTAAQPDPAAAEAKLGEDPNFKPFKEKYDKSRKQTFRLDYEVDFNDYLKRLTDMATFDKSKYLYPLKYMAPDQY